jgi:2-polyprenyl-3-methyl-5-hydroxy-6-metoxy-1,4-benzoquinol methylase
MTTQAADIDLARAEAFGEQIVAVLNGAALALMLSIGHETRLFDTMSEAGPVTSDELAERAALNERYVREWLGAMTAGRIVEYDAASKRYRLPPEHAASLTRAAGPRNLASVSQIIPLLGNVEDGVVRSFRKGGGVPYARFPKFQELMREVSAAVSDATLIETTLPLVPGLISRLEQGIDVLDVGCGSGHAVNVMARAFPRSRFTGYDFSEEGISRARSEASEWGLPNARFEVKDVATLDGAVQFDLITAFDAIHDQAHPAHVLVGISRSLRPHGTFLCVDIAASSNVEENIDHPLGAYLYTVSTMHCMTVSLALGGDGLGTCWGEQLARRMLHEAGFASIDVRRVEGDILNNYYIARKD